MIIQTESIYWITWGPGGRLHHAGEAHPSDREHSGAEATSPTLPGCSAVEHGQKHVKKDYKQWTAHVTLGSGSFR